MDRFFQKIEAGAEYAMTQPVFDVELFLKFMEKIKGVKIPILAGLLPLVSYKNAEFLHNEVPGMQIPENIRERMKKTAGTKSGSDEGIAIATELFSQIKSVIGGIYIIPQLNKLEIASKIIKNLNL